MSTDKTPDTLEVIKVVLKGAITSFRYPYFVQGMQPTYEMPPPSTLYGYICACIGTFEPPETLQFGVHFTYDAKFMDLEQVQIDSLKSAGSSKRELTMNVFQRELLFNPTLTLYLTPTQYLESFLRPHYPLALGRSQDLMTCVSAKIVTLKRVQRAYFEHTLLPASYAPRFKKTVAVTMARYIDESRIPTWGHFAIVKERMAYPDVEDPFSHEYAPVWIDEDAPLMDDELARGVILHQFISDEVS